MSQARQPFLDYATVLARWMVGGLFVYMGLVKALDPVTFLKLVRQYELTQSPLLLNFIAGALPWFEIACGLLLLAGVAVRGSALITFAMLVPFTVVVTKRALALQASQHIAFCQIHLDCGCGGGDVLICHKLLENCALAVVSLWLLAGRGRQLSLRYDLMKPSRTEEIGDRR